MKWIDLFNFILKNWKYIVFSMIFLAVGFAIAWRIQGVRIDRLQTKINQQQIELAQCVDANRINQQTITVLQNETKKANQVCLSRIRIKEQTIKKIQKIEKMETKNEDSGSDPLLDALNGMY